MISALYMVINMLIMWLQFSCDASRRSWGLRNLLGIGTNIVYLQKEIWLEICIFKGMAGIWSLNEKIFKMATANMWRGRKWYSIMHCSGWQMNFAWLSYWLQGNCSKVGILKSMLSASKKMWIRNFPTFFDTYNFKHTYHVCAWNIRKNMGRRWVYPLAKVGYPPHWPR